MPSQMKTSWKRSALAVGLPVLAALIIGLGSTAWGLYTKVHELEKELVAERTLNAAQQKELDRLWDNLTDLWKNASAAVRGDGG